MITKKKPWRLSTSELNKTLDDLKNSLRRRNTSITMAAREARSMVEEIDRLRKINA